jgi:EmrB/QacA subfamily drug resistance transporter
MPPAAAPPDPRRWWTLGVLCLSLIVISLDNTILNTALPTMQRELHASASQLQWIVDAYMLVFAGLLLTAGSLGDRFGRRGALEIGLGIFGLGSLLSALAPNAGTLIASRALMGVGGALIMPTTLSILTNVFPAGERAKAIGIWSAVSGLGIAIGPVAGGWLIEHASWNAVFLVNLPFVLAAFPLSRALVPESKDPSAPKLDPRGFVLSISGLTALVWAIIQAPDHGWTSPTIIAAFGASALLLGTFAWWELRAPSPMLDLAFFRNPRFSSSSIAIALAFFALFGTIFLLTQYLQGVLGHDALTAGLWVAPVAAGLAFGAGLSARLAERFGAKLVVTLGLVVLAGGLSMITLAGLGSGFSTVLAYELVIGLGIGLAMAPATDAVMGSLPLEKAGVGSAVNDTTRTAGGALGVAILGSVLSSIYRGDMAGLPAAARDSLSGALSLHDPQIAETARTAFVHGMHGAALLAAGVALGGAILALVALPAREPTPATTPAAALEPVPA